MADNRGVFTLRKIIEDRVPLDRWVDLQEVWVNSQDDSESLRFNDNLVSYNTGYFGGGEDSDGDDVSTMDKLSYADDTTAAVPASGSLSGARLRLAATGNSTAGYFGGGNDSDGDIITTMDKLSYASDTISPLPATGRLSAARKYYAATGNSTAGYFGGGNDSDGDIITTMDKLSYADDTTAAVPGANLSSARSNHAATGNSTAGYFGGGEDSDGDIITTMDKLSYADDTTAAVPSSGSLSPARYALAATGNSTAGYFGGGETPLVSTMDKISYSNDTRAAVPGANLSEARSYLASTSSRANGLPQPLPPTPTPGPSIV